MVPIQSKTEKDRMTVNFCEILELRIPMKIYFVHNQHSLQRVPNSIMLHVIPPLVTFHKTFRNTTFAKHMGNIGRICIPMLVSSVAFKRAPKKIKCVYQKIFSIVYTYSISLYKEWVPYDTHYLIQHLSFLRRAEDIWMTHTART